jgi:hypothetical protein
LNNAARAVTERILRDRYAIATDAGNVIALPVEGTR